MIRPIGEWVLALAGGFLAGGLYFGGLWWTTRRVLQARRPAVFLLASYLVRAALALALFYFFMDGSGLKLLVCLGGFLFMRLALTRALRPGKRRPSQTTPKRELV
ncbi:MAG: ATP synthase subunit I [Desulfobacterota bacterium]|nr:ATP synthase subunit I [Thermodesulfobacteriota bacterium]